MSAAFTVPSPKASGSPGRAHAQIEPGFLVTVDVINFDRTKAPDPVHEGYDLLLGGFGGGPLTQNGLGHKQILKSSEIARAARAIHFLQARVLDRLARILRLFRQKVDQLVAQFEGGAGHKLIADGDEAGTEVESQIIRVALERYILEIR